jgi:hypothetical protein
MARKGKFVFLVILASLLVLLISAGIAGRALVLHRIRAAVGSAFEYSRMSLSILPPALVLEGVKSRPPGPVFSARRVTVTTGLLSLLSKTRPVSIFIDRPVAHLSAADVRKLTGPSGSRSLPFTISRALVREADITVETGSFVLQSLKASGSYRTRGASFSLEAAIGNNVLTLARSRNRYEAGARFLIEGRGGRLQFKRLTLDGPSLTLKVKGVLANLADPEMDLSVVFNGLTALPMDIFAVPFEWGGKTRGEGTVRRANKILLIDTSLSSSDTTMTGMPVGDLTGRFQLHAGRGDIDLTVANGSEPRSSIKILFGGGLVRGILSGVTLDPVMKEIRLAWPVQSPAWGEFTVRNDRLHVEAELRSPDLVATRPDRFPFRGKATVDWDGHTRVTFDSRKLASSFGVIDVSGTVDIGRDLDINLTGEVGDVVQARRFTELFLKTKFGIPETSGRGSGEVRVTGAWVQPTITAQFFLYPGGFGKFRAAFVEGTLGLKGGFVKSLIRVDDPQLTGVVNVQAVPGTLDVDIKATRARLEYVLPCLDLSLPLAGEASGQFRVKLRGQDLGVSGDFAAASASILKLPVRDVKGKLDFGLGSLAFPELRFSWNHGLVQGTGRVGFETKEYEIDLGGRSIDLAPLLPGLRGLLSFDFKGRGSFDRQPILGRVEVSKPGYDGLQGEALSADVSLSASDDTVRAKLKGNFGPGSNGVDLDFALPLRGGSYDLNLKGGFENLDILLPLNGAKGRVNYLVRVQGTADGPRLRGAIDAQGQVLPLPGFPQALENFSALAFLDNEVLTLRSFQATLGGGGVHASGEVRLSGPGPLVNLGLEAKDMILVPWERTRALADANLRLRGDPGRFVLEGDVFFQRLSWRREIGESFALSTQAYYQPGGGPSPFENLGLNVRLRADDNAWIENSLGRIRSRFNLTLTGTVNAPVLLGDIEALSGTFNFQDRTFNILSGKLSFFNPVSVEPYIDLRAESYVKDYRVTLSLNGLLNRLRPEFTSSPPLPPEDVLALLATGESFKRTYISDVSSQLSSATLLAYQLSEQAQKRASKLFSLDRISIDPFIMGSTTELVPRLTLGKRISRNVFIYYSTNLTTQREEIVRMEWELGRNFSLVGNRDELGIISLDVKLRKRF